MKDQGAQEKETTVTGAQGTGLNRQEARCSTYKPTTSAQSPTILPNEFQQNADLGI